MNERDPIELFGLLDPTEAISDTERDEALLAEIVGADRPTPRKIDRRRWITGGAIAAAGLATAAFAVLRVSPVDDPTAVTCMVTTDPDGDRFGLPASDDPVAACAELWTDGTLGTGQPPRLAACVNDVGAAVVFPSGSAICSRLGLAELDAGLSDEQQRVVDVQDALAELFGTRCFTQDAAIEETRRRLDAARLTEWTIDVPEPFDATGMCAGPGFDVNTQRVVLSAVREP